MSGLISKRQQARNEKVLQDLVQSVPGNNLCADCQARNPSWASWNLGIFLCMRCAAIHRKLGTHISKVKSLSMDSWTNEQVDSMKKTGNVSSNKVFNPKNKQPPVPVDADEADGAMERFIRAKYVQTGSSNGATRNHTGTESDEGTPPPLPPKTGGRFGFSKANSSTFPLSFRSSKKEARSMPSSPHDYSGERSPSHLSNKPSKVFGANVGPDTPEAMEAKLRQLRDMGFMDDKRNAMILKGVNGSVEKTIEALVRLGEGSGHSPVPPKVPSRDSSLPAPRTLTPQRSFDVSALGSGKKSPVVQSPTSPSNNPWDIQPAQPQSSQSTGTIPNHNNPFYHQTAIDNTNPFGFADGGVTQSMQNLSLAPPTQQQQLFPHHTGGVPGPQAMLQQQSMTQPIPQQMNNYGLQPQSTGYNPFLQAPPQAQQQLSLNTAPTSPYQQVQQSMSQPQSPASHAGNPFLRSPSTLSSLNQIPEQSQQNIYTSPSSPYGGNNPFMGMQSGQQQPVQQQSTGTQNPWGIQQPQQQQNPFGTMQQPQQQQQMNPWQTQQPQQGNPYQTQQPQQQYLQMTGMSYQQPQVNKASIMALYGSSPNPSPFGSQPPATQQQQQQLSLPQRSVSVPLTGTSNPFLGAAGAPSAAPVPGGLAAKAGINPSQIGAVENTTPAAPNAASPFASAQSPFGNSAPAPFTSTVSTTSPFAGGPAPFAGSAASGVGVGAGAPTTGLTTNTGPSPFGGARSRESIMADMGWNQSGRHSPDAFASFSARS